MSATQNLIIGLALILLSVPALAAEIEGFTEPYRTVEVAAHEMGIITAVNYRVGDQLKKGDVAATLDDDIHRLLVESALARKEARGRLESARAELNLRKTRLSKLEAVVALGHGRKEEVERAKADRDIAAANVLVAEDEILIRTLEHRRLLTELERRKVRSPLDGVVVKNSKEVGEFVAPNDPRILTVVQLNPLLAKFSLRRSRAERVQLGQKMKVSFANTPEAVEGVVEEISPVMDAESGTIRVRLRVDNSAGKLRSGQRCLLQMADLFEEDDASVASVPAAKKEAVTSRPLYQTKPVAGMGEGRRRRGF